MPQKEDENHLEQRIKDYEDKYIANASKKQKEEWSKIVDIVSKRNFKSKKPLVLIATPEITHLPENMGNLAHIIKTGDGGGLADISASLVAELDRQGVNVHATFPDYKDIFLKNAKINREEYEKLKKERGETRVHPIQHGLFSSAERVYGDGSQHLDKIELRRANAFMGGIINLFPYLKSINDNVIIHCNDWMTGLIPAAAKVNGMQSLMTFHNIFTWKQWPLGLQKHGIDISEFWNYLYLRDSPNRYGGSFEGNYTNNEVDFMASGLFAADYINTVSPTFLKEIVYDPSMGRGIIPDSMRGIIQDRYSKGSAVGILNAPSETADPRKDDSLVQKYWYEDCSDEGVIDIKEGKKRNKAYFQKCTGLEQNPDSPLFFWPSRIAYPQKGFELLLHNVPYLMDRFRNMQIAVVACGDMNLIHWVEKYQNDFRGRVSYKPFLKELNQMGKAAADFIIIPSLYEPCGIPQVEAPRYGTLPIVRRTGGLADTVEHLSPNGLSGNGFVFNDYIKEGLWYGIDQAIGFYNQDEQFKLGVQKRIMKESFEKFNIEKTAGEYIKVYEKILSFKDPNLRLR